MRCAHDENDADVRRRRALALLCARWSAKHMADSGPLRRLGSAAHVQLEDSAPTWSGCCSMLKQTVAFKLMGDEFGLWARRRGPLYVALPLQARSSVCLSTCFEVPFRDSRVKSRATDRERVSTALVTLSWCEAIGAKTIDLECFQEPGRPRCESQVPYRRGGVGDLVFDLQGNRGPNEFGRRHHVTGEMCTNKPPFRHALHKTCAALQTPHVPQSDEMLGVWAQPWECPLLNGRTRPMLIIRLPSRPPWISMEVRVCVPE